MDCMTVSEVNGNASPSRSLMCERRDDVKGPRLVSLCRRSAVDDRVRGLQRRGGVLRTATVLTALHRMHVLNLGRAPLATPQQELPTL